MIQGTLYIISAPSGAGKSSLIKALMKTQLSYNTKISVSHTTREIRPGEKHGQHYFFIPVTEFKRMITEDLFLEYAQVFGNYYGTSRKSIAQILTKGMDVLLDIDWQGAQQIRKKIPDTRSIFILPPSKDELYRRLCKRARDIEEVVAQRMSQAVNEITHFKEYDYLVINDDFNTALLDLKTIIQAEHLRFKYQKILYNKLIDKLLSE